MSYETILYEEQGPVGWLTLNRPDDGNMFTAQMCHEIRDCIDDIRRETRTRVLVITGAGDRFFCIGGRKIRDEVNLADRGHFIYPVLIGRNMLGKGDFLLDPSRTFVSRAPCAKHDDDEN